MSAPSVPLALAGLWALTTVAAVWIIVREILALRNEPLEEDSHGPVRFAPDPAFADPAFAEDAQVAYCEAIPLPEPWSPDARLALRFMADMEEWTA